MVSGVTALQERFLWKCNKNYWEEDFVCHKWEDYLLMLKENGSLAV